MFQFCGLDLPNNIFLAPMAGITTRSFRTIALSFGAGLAYSEMISAEGLVRGDRKTRGFLPRGGEGGAVAAQIFGHRPESLREAARIVEESAAVLIDINMGCPVRKIVKGGSGCALMRDPELIGRILTEVCPAVTKPVTVKIRSGWDDGSRNAVAVAKIATDCGAAAVTIHGRTARQGFSGRADWDVVAAAAAEVAIPIVGSGDLKEPEEAEAAFRQTGCAAVMIGRAALGRPWIFGRIDAARRGRAFQEPSRKELGKLMLRHLELSLEEFGDYRGVLNMRRPLAWYSRGLPAAVEFRRGIHRIQDAAVLRREILALTGA